jgi:hypothetical protein
VSVWAVAGTVAVVLMDLFSSPLNGLVMRWLP